MISFPRAKINLGLSVVSKRPDGFHNLETIFYPLPLHDALEIVPANFTRFTPAGLKVEGESRDNLVLRAYQKLQNEYPQTGALDIHLLKKIPIGAGLGGGSSDAAAMILMVSRFFGIRIPTDRLLILASETGSDCPFFLQDHPCFATGRGEILEPLSLNLSGYSFLLIHPEKKIDTAWAFSQIIPAAIKYNLKDCISKPVQEWKNTIINDFEIPVFEALPFLKEIKELLYAAGALYASMTGSGSTIFGIFKKGKRPHIPVQNAGQTWIA